MGQNRISHKHGGDQWPIEPRKRDEAERTPGPGERERDSDDANNDRCRDERWTRSAFNKGNLGSTDDMDDERLREKRFGEPTGWKSDGLSQAWNTNNIIA